MASIRKRGETFTITAYMGYDEQGKQRKKTTTFRPPDGVTAGKAEKLAKAFAATWEEKIRGYVALDENRTFSELAEWYLGTNMNNKLKRIIAGTDLPQDLHLHSMRHTHASLLINSDVAARVIADRLGHSTTKTTLDTYSHVFAESEARAMQAIDMALFRQTR